jgi:hypothetical protein
MRTALQLLGRVARLEAEARDATTPTVGATIADILSGRRPGPRTTDEQMASGGSGGPRPTTRSGSPARGYGKAAPPPGERRQARAGIPADAGTRFPRHHAPKRSYTVVTGGGAGCPWPPAAGWISRR